jgi:hypothetical protein
MDLFLSVPVELASVGGKYVRSGNEWLHKTFDKFWSEPHVIVQKYQTFAGRSACSSLHAADNPCCD